MLGIQKVRCWSSSNTKSIPVPSGNTSRPDKPRARAPGVWASSTGQLASPMVTRGGACVGIAAGVASGGADAAGARVGRTGAGGADTAVGKAVAGSSRGTLGISVAAGRIGCAGNSVASASMGWAGTSVATGKRVTVGNNPTSGTAVSVGRGCGRLIGSAKPASVQAALKISKARSIET